jgi:hypothetical protein
MAEFGDPGASDGAIARGRIAAQASQAGARP